MSKAGPYNQMYDILGYFDLLMVEFQKKSLDEQYGSTKQHVQYKQNR